MKFISEYITWIHVEEGRRCFGEDDKVCVCNEREREREDTDGMTSLGLQCGWWSREVVIAF